MIRVLATFWLLCAHQDVSALKILGRLKPYHPAPTRKVTIGQSEFRIFSGKLYRNDIGGPPKRVDRSEHLVKITRFGDDLAGLTYDNELLIWREVEPGTWTLNSSLPASPETIDLAGNNHGAITVTAFGRLQHWITPTRQSLVPGVDFVTAVEAYTNDPGFGVILPDHSVIHFDPQKSGCELQLRLSGGHRFHRPRNR